MVANETKAGAAWSPWGIRVRNQFASGFGGQSGSSRFSRQTGGGSEPHLVGGGFDLGCAGRGRLCPVGSDATTSRCGGDVGGMRGGNVEE